MVNNCSNYILYLEISVGLYYFSLSIYEFYIIHIYYQKNNNDGVLAFILCKAIFNVLIIPTNLLNILYLFNIKFIRFINFILGLWGIIEWRLYDGENKDYQNILFLEFIIFQFIYSMYFIYYLFKINNYENNDNQPTNSINVVVLTEESEEINNKIEMVDVIKIDNSANTNILINATSIENPIINVNAIKFEEDSNHNIYQYRYPSRNFF